MSVVIALGHKARQGKGEVVAKFQELAGYLGLTFEKISFADALREEVKAKAEELFYNRYGTLGQAHFDGHEAMRTICEYFGQPFDENPLVDKVYPWGKQRKLYQFYGTEYRRAQDEDYWVKRAEEKIYASKADVIGFDDLRFVNEYDMIGRLGGLRVKISRLGWVSDVPEHVSETALDGYQFDASIAVADGRLPMLQALAAGLFSHATFPLLEERWNRGTSTDIVRAA